MKTDKDIRKFMHENRMAVPKDDRFMEEVVRQINLLPVPSSLSGGGDVEEKMALLKVIRDVLKKRARRQTLATLLISAFICGLSFVCLWLCASCNSGSALTQSLYTWRYAILGFVSLCSLAFAFYQTRIYIR